MQVAEIVKITDATFRRGPSMISFDCFSTRGLAMVNAANVLRIVATTLAISAAVDFVSGYLGYRVPWYATTALLTLFMYACESDLNYQARLTALASKERIRP